jgi:hypothetical protein
LPKHVKHGGQAITFWNGRRNMNVRRQAWLNVRVGNFGASFTRGISRWQYIGQRHAAAAINQLKRVPRFKAPTAHGVLSLILAQPCNVPNGGKFFNNASRMGHA